MGEQTFWRRMHPTRLHALYDAWFSMAAAGRKEPAPLPDPPKEKKSLYEFLMGGGA